MSEHNPANVIRVERFIPAHDPNRNDAYCTPGDHRILNAQTGDCEWCGNARRTVCACSCEGCQDCLHCLKGHCVR